HLFGILFESDFPIRAARTITVREIGEHARNLAIFSYTPEPNIRCIGEGNENGHAIAAETKKIEALAGGSKVPGADVLYSANSLIGIDYFVTDLKIHTGSPTNHRCQVLFVSYATTLECYA